MDKLQKARIDLWQVIRGRFIPDAVLADIRYNVDEDVLHQFYDIYKDEKLSVLLLVNDASLSGLMALWEELFPQDELNPEVLEFLLSYDYARVKRIWQDELTNFVRNITNEERRPYLTALSEALYFGLSDKNSLVVDMLEKQCDTDDAFSVYTGFCLIILYFDLISEDMLPLFYKALGRYRKG